MSIGHQTSGPLRTNARASQPCAAGFSLLEMLVVLVIMAGAAGLMLPRFGKGPPPTAVQSMALQLATDLRATRDEALRTNAEQSFTFERDKRVTWSLARPTPRRFVDGVAIDITGPGLEWVGDRAVQFRFQPSGGATGGEITVRDSRAATRISVDWLTGVARIERVR
jgi:general secretion pathway protein H